MPYVEQRGPDRWRVRWKQADGTYSGGVTKNEQTGQYFASDEEARTYGVDQETLIRLGLRKDRKKIKFAERANTWYAAQSLEPTTMAKYRSLLQGHLLPRWASTPLEVEQFDPEIVDPWEQSIIRAGYAPRTAYDARSLLITILNDCVPQYMDYNPAERRRGKGRKGLRRVARALQAAKVWPTPLQVVLLAERAALLAANEDVFVLLVAKGWTGLRWSEVLALTPAKLRAGQILDINQKLYELKDFYLSHPKDGSIRQLDNPRFLWAMLHGQAQRARECSCTGRSNDLPRVDGEEHVTWCAGGRYLFLTPAGTHYQRGNFADHVMRPAADGAYPGRKGARARPPRPVLADAAVYGASAERGRRLVVEGAVAWPGRPVYWPWPYAEPGVDFVPPRGRGRPDWPNWPEGARPHLVSWRPLVPGLTVHGLRHGHQTALDDAGIRQALKVERMGHEDASMSARYGHITDGMREQLVDLLQGLWENAIAERFKIHPYSQIPALDRELAAWREGTASKVISQISPKNERRARHA